MNYTVLIVDDEAMPRKVLKEHLPWDSLGVTKIFQASDGLEAVEQARQCLPDIVISDIKMPHMDGIQMAAAIREFCPHCQFIFLSGYSDKEYLKGAIKLKAANYVEKPIDLEEIEQALSEVIKELDEQQKEESPDTRRILFSVETKIRTRRPILPFSRAARAISIPSQRAYGIAKNPIRRPFCADYPGKPRCVRALTRTTCAIFTARLYFCS